MRDDDKTKDQLLNELVEIRRRIAELGASQTERKRAEEALQKRTHDLDERVKELNCLYAIASLVEKPGISLEEILQGTVDLIPPALQYPEIACARVVLEDQEFRTNNFEETTWKQACHIIVHGDRIGTLEVCYLEEKPERDEEPFLKEEEHLLNAIAERLGKVAERKRAEEALHKSQEHAQFLADVLERSSQPLAVGYPDGRLMTYNTAYCKLLGYSKEELHKLKWSTDLTPPEWREVVAKATEEIRRTGQPQRFQKEYIRKDGSRVPVEVLAHPIFDSKGNLQYYYSFFTDITERKRMEEALIKAKDELEIKVKERTAELESLNEGLQKEISHRKRTEDELRALSHRLVEIQEEERRAIGRELHDQTGQSLTALKLSLDRAVSSPAENGGSILGEAQAVLQELMAHVRDLSLDLWPSILDELGLLPALLWHFDRYSAQTQVRVNFEHAGLQRDLAPHISTAAYRIVQEALTNVARHARVDEVRIRAWTDKNTLYVRIEDQGTGFDPATLGISRSSGLKGIRERGLLSGGKVTIESAPGAGTTVIAELPLSGQSRKSKRRP